MKLNILFILSLIVDLKLRQKARHLWNKADEWFFHDAASKTGKYHPAFDLGDGGVCRHSLLVAYFAHEGALTLGLSQRDIDICTISGLLHDIKKAPGPGAPTAFDHPTAAAEYIRNEFPGDDDMNIVADAVSTHMGKWNTCSYSDVVLPTPTTQIQCIVAMADMIASRKVLDSLNNPETWEVN